MMDFMPAGEMSASEDNSQREDSGLTRIGDMARDFGVTLRALRFYEDKGLLNPKREGSTRLYTRKDKARLKLVLMGRRIGFSLREVKQMIDLYDPEGSNVRQMKLLLEKGERQKKKLEKQRVEIEQAEAELDELMDGARSRLDSGQSGTVN